MSVQRCVECGRATTTPGTDVQCDRCWANEASPYQALNLKYLHRERGKLHRLDRCVVDEIDAGSVAA